MCGIIGFVNSNVTLDGDSLHHRGPDSLGTFSDGLIQLVHTRLAIQDLSVDSNQPFFSECGQYVLIFNGEIYNHLELRNDLTETRFKTQCDTETVLYALIQHGVHALSMLNGIFALALYNLEDNTLLIARDRFGVKPLYWGTHENSMVFGSEIKALKSWEYFGSEYDIVALENYVRFLWSPGIRTPLKSIKKLKPGTFLKLKISPEFIKLEQETFWASRVLDQVHFEEEVLVDELSKRLEKAVERQLLSDVPVGFFLSGGLDSSLIVAIAKKLQPKNRLQCFTIDTAEFSETEGFSNDLRFAKEVAEYLDVDLEVVKAGSNILEDFDKVIWHLDEPQADAAPLNVYNISVRAREMGFKVLIGGTGGDDVFSGYRRHKALKHINNLAFLPSWIFKILKFSFDKMAKNRPIFRRMSKLFYSLSESGNNRVYSLFEWLPFTISSKLFNLKVSETDRFSFFESVGRRSSLNRINLDHLLQIEKESFLVDHNFNYTDKMGMATGVEIRVPYLDNELEEFSRRIPEHFKIQKNETKYILKKVAERYLPKDIIYREESGIWGACKEMDSDGFT